MINRSNTAMQVERWTSAAMTVKYIEALTGKETLAFLIRGRICVGQESSR
jgi:hypothetical protein